MKHKTSELSGAVLDAVVAKAEGVPVYADALEGAMWHGNREYRPSADWSLGGPIIERERIAIWPCGDDDGWTAMHPDADNHGAYLVNGTIDACSGDGSDGETPLIAAMRAYVAHNLGDEVDLP